MRESLNPPAFPVDCNTNPDCDAAGMRMTVYLRDRLKLAISEVHSGNSTEADNIVALCVDAMRVATKFETMIAETPPPVTCRECGGNGYDIAWARDCLEMDRHEKQDGRKVGPA